LSYLDLIQSGRAAEDSCLIMPSPRVFESILSIIYLALRIRVRAAIFCRRLPTGAGDQSLKGHPLPGGFERFSRGWEKSPTAATETGPKIGQCVSQKKRPRFGIVFQKKKGSANGRQRPLAATAGRLVFPLALAARSNNLAASSVGHPFWIEPADPRLARGAGECTAWRIREPAKSFVHDPGARLGGSEWFHIPRTDAGEDRDCGVVFRSFASRLGRSRPCGRRREYRR